MENVREKVLVDIVKMLYIKHVAKDITEFTMLSSGLFNFVEELPGYVSHTSILTYSQAAQLGEIGKNQYEQTLLIYCFSRKSYSWLF
jgi:hypothetical protein